MNLKSWKDYFLNKFINLQPQIIQGKNESIIFSQESGIG